MTLVECPRCGELQSNGLCQCLYFPNSLEKKAVGTGNLCGFCGAEGHGVDECSKRFAVYFPAAPAQAAVADADRAVAGFVDRKLVNLDPDYRTIDMDLKKDLTDPIKRLCSPAKLTGVERDAAISMDYLLAMDIPASELERIMLRVREAMAARQALGREKYPTTLAENHAKFEERVRHAWEEALDGLAYSQWMFWGWKIPRPDNPAYNRSGRDYEAGAAMRCVKLFSQVLAELDALMRHCNMDPVRKEGQP